MIVMAFHCLHYDYKQRPVSHCCNGILTQLINIYFLIFFSLRLLFIQSVARLFLKITTTIFSPQDKQLALLLGLSIEVQNRENRQGKILVYLERIESWSWPKLSCLCSIEYSPKLIRLLCAQALSICYPISKAPHCRRYIVVVDRS